MGPVLRKDTKQLRKCLPLQNALAYLSQRKLDRIEFLYDVSQIEAQHLKKKRFFRTKIDKISFRLRLIYTADFAVQFRNAFLLSSVLKTQPTTAATDRG